MYPERKGDQSIPGGSAFGGFAITPSDTDDLPCPVHGIYVGVAGHVKVTGFDRQVVTYKNVPVGVLPVCALRVWTVVGSATEMIGMI
jgi:hypothetical protein